MLDEQIDVRDEGTITIVSLNGQFIGGEETDALRDVFVGLTKRERPYVIVDLADVSYLNSSFISALLAAHAALARRGGVIALAGMNGTIGQIFAVTKLELVFPLFPTVEVAKSSQKVSS